MTARDQLRWLVDELDDEQAERALMVLESSAEWVLTGELAVVHQHGSARRDRHRSSDPVTAVSTAAGRHSG